MFSRIAHLVELADVSRDFASRIADDAHIRASHRRRNKRGCHKAEDSRRERAGQGGLPFHEVTLSPQSLPTLRAHYGKSSGISHHNRDAYPVFLLARGLGWG